MHGPMTSLRRFEWACLLAIAALSGTLRTSDIAAQQSAPGPTSVPATSASPGTTASPGSASPAAPAPSAPRGMPTPEQLEPGVNTSSSSVSEAPAHPSTASDKPGDASDKPRGNASPRQTSANSAAHKGPDRLQLDATEITGNRELPKVLYIVPWKRSDLGDLTGRPVNSLLDEVLQPLDRDVFQRENRYYNGLKPPAAASKGDASGGPGTKP
jgi:hypothetical protein